MTVDSEYTIGVPKLQFQSKKPSAHAPVGSLDRQGFSGWAEPGQGATLKPSKRVIASPHKPEKPNPVKRSVQGPPPGKEPEHRGKKTFDTRVPDVTTIARKRHITPPSSGGAEIAHLAGRKPVIDDNGVNRTRQTGREISPNRQIGRKIKVDNVRNGIQERNPGDKNYPTPEYSPHFYKNEGIVPQTVWRKRVYRIGIERRSVHGRKGHNESKGPDSDASSGAGSTMQQARSCQPRLTYEEKMAQMALEEEIQSTYDLPPIGDVSDTDEEKERAAIEAAKAAEAEAAAQGGDKGGKDKDKGKGKGKGKGKKGKKK